jgi:hypothetical protein
MDKKRKIAQSDKRCAAMTIKNEQCPYQHVEGSIYCKKHKDGPVKKIVVEIETCEALTNKFLRCPFKHAPNSIYCVKHTKKRDFGTIHEMMKPKKKQKVRAEGTMERSCSYVLLTPPPLRYNTALFGSKPVVLYKCNHYYQND